MDPYDTFLEFKQCKSEVLKRIHFLHRLLNQRSLRKLDDGDFLSEEQAEISLLEDTLNYVEGNFELPRWALFEVDIEKNPLIELR